MTQPNIPEEWIPFSCGIFAFACFLLSWYQNVSVHFCCLLQFVLHNRNSTFSEMCQLYIMPLSAVCYASVSCMLCLCQLCYASVSCMSRLCQLCVTPLSAVCHACQLYVTPLSAVCHASVSCMLCLCQLCYACVSCMSRPCQLYVMSLVNFPTLKFPCCNFCLMPSYCHSRKLC